MRRIQVVIDPELDDRLEQEAAARGMSKSALIRECVRDRMTGAQDNGLLKLLGLAGDAEPVDDIDEYLYGSLRGDA